MHSLFPRETLIIEHGRFSKFMISSSRLSRVGLPVSHCRAPHLLKAPADLVGEYRMRCY